MPVELLMYGGIAVVVGVAILVIGAYKESDGWQHFGAGLFGLAGICLIVWLMMGIAVGFE